MRLLPLLFAIVFFTGCAVAPLSNHTSARVNGKGQSILAVGSTIGVGNTGWVPSVRYSVGVHEKIDVAFQYEVVEWGASLKYLLHGGQDGLSVSGLAGTGLGFEGFYLFLGPVLSYKIGIFEPYFVERFNFVHYPKKSSIDVDSVGEVHVDPGSYRYFQHTLGFFLWPVDSVGVGLEVSAFSTVSSPFILRGRDKFLLSGNFSFRF